MADLSSLQAITRMTFDPTSLTGSYQPLNGSGFSDDVKIFQVYNGSSSGIDISLDGVNDHFYWPPGMTLIVDSQANHADNSAYGSGTLYVRKGQIIWGKTTANPAFIFMMGYR